MSTELDFTVTLTPVGSVDTSSSSRGVSMFSFYMDQSFNVFGNAIQFEYWIHASGEQSVASQQTTGFIALEDAVTCQGISNQFTIAIPALTNDYDETDEYEVQMRVYIGLTTGSEINVSGWSNPCKLHPPPEQPLNPIAFIYRGENSGYSVNDMLFVQIDNTTRNIGGSPVPVYGASIQFVISYYYTDSVGVTQWVVSTPKDWSTSEDDAHILINSVILPIDASYDNNLYVAVNALFTYQFDGNNYYSMSEISETVVATNASFNAPSLNPIVIPTDYHIYKNVTERAQNIVLSWSHPIAKNVPGYAVDSYSLSMSDGTNTHTIPNISSTSTQFEYGIPTEVLILGEKILSFIVSVVYETGETQESNPQSVKTFTHATAPQTVEVAWANQHRDDTDFIDIALTFVNPTSIGFGTQPEFNVKLDGHPEVYNVAYDSTKQRYVFYLPNVPNCEGLTVYVVTTNTNANTIDGAYTRELGDSVHVPVTSSEVPYVYDISNVDLTGNFIFKVISNTLLDLVCTLVVWNVEENGLEALPFLTLGGNSNLYTIQRDENEVTGDYEYSMTFLPAYFGGIVPSHIMAVCSNAVGTGTGRN